MLPITVSSRLSLSHIDPCGYTIPAVLGITLRTVPVVGVVTQSFIMCAFAIERSISTIWPSKYEGIHKPYIGLALGIISVIRTEYKGKNSRLQMLLGGGAVYVLILMPVEWHEVQITSTVRTRANQGTYQVTPIIPGDSFLSDSNGTVHVCGAVDHNPLLDLLLRQQKILQLQGGAGPQLEVPGSPPLPFSSNPVR